MMIRICVFGDSHVGALRRAWDVHGPLHPGLDLVFFAAQGKSMSGLTVEGQQIIASNESLAKRIAYTSGGHSTVAVADFDAFLVYGLFALPPLDARLSSAVAEATLEDRYNGSINGDIAALIAELCDAPIFVGHKPMRLGGPAGDRRGRLRPYPEVMATLARVRSPRLQFVSQPAETVLDDWGTPTRYAQGSLRLETRSDLKNVAHHDDDVPHMGAEFGELYLKALLPRLSAAARRADPPSASARS